MCFFLYFPENAMRNLQLAGLGLVIAGSFLPLVHVPLIGNWAYYELDPYLAVFCWIFCALALLGILKNRIFITRLAALLLSVLFIFTILAVKWKSMDFFSFLPLASWRSFAAGMVKLRWGWLAEFAGAALLLWPRISGNND